ncbi:hypothetical protein CWI38_2064p0020, partial [Hamiltosporidium tvaerminnensis]
HLLLLNRYKFKSSKRIRSHSVQEILDNEYAEIRVDTRIKTDVKIRNNRPDIFILDKKKNKITLIEVGITSQDSLQIVETEKLRKYDLLANELGLIYKCSVEIIPYVMTWDGIVTKYHKSHLKRLEIPMNVEAYIQSIVLRKTVETISFDRRRGLESGLNAEESWERASMGVIMRSEMREEPIPPLKEAKREEDGVKILKPKNNTPLISQGGTTLEEPTNNINEESDLEEETIVVKESLKSNEDNHNKASSSFMTRESIEVDEILQSNEDNQNKTPSLLSEAKGFEVKENSPDTINTGILRGLDSREAIYTSQISDKTNPLLFDKNSGIHSVSNFDSISSDEPIATYSNISCKRRRLDKKPNAKIHYGTRNERQSTVGNSIQPKVDIKPNAHNGDTHNKNTEPNRNHETATKKYDNTLTMTEEPKQQSYIDKNSHILKEEEPIDILKKYICKILDDKIFFEQLKEKINVGIRYNNVLNALTVPINYRVASDALENKPAHIYNKECSAFASFREHLTNLTKTYLNNVDLDQALSILSPEKFDYGKFNSILSEYKALICRITFTNEIDILSLFECFEKLVEFENIYVGLTPQNKTSSLLSQIGFSTEPQLEISKEIYNFINKHEKVENILSSIKRNRLLQLNFLVCLFNCLSKKLSQDIIGLGNENRTDLFQESEKKDNKLILENVLLLRKILLRIFLCLKDYDSITAIYSLLIWFDYVLEKNKLFFSEEYCEIKEFINFCFETIMTNKMAQNNRFLMEVLSFITIVISKNSILKAPANIF